MKMFNAKHFILAMLVVMAGGFFASCGGDDDINDNTEDITLSDPDAAILGSWKTTWNSNVNGTLVPAYEILTFNADGTGFTESEELGHYSKDPIRYDYDSGKQILNIRSERNGYNYNYIYMVKSISSTKLVLMSSYADEGEYEVYYRI